MSRLQQDMCNADKERVAAEIAAMDPAVLATIKKASADARAAKKEKKADKAHTVSPGVSGISMSSTEWSAPVSMHDMQFALSYALLWNK